MPPPRPAQSVTAFVGSLRASLGEKADEDHVYRILVALQSWGTPGAWGAAASSGGDAANAADPYATQSVVTEDVEEDDEDLFDNDAAMVEAEDDNKLVLAAQEKNETPAAEVVARIASRQSELLKVAKKNQLRKKNTVGVRKTANGKASS